MLGFFLGSVNRLLWLLASIHSIGYMAKEHAHDRYYCFLLLSLGGCLGTVFAGELVGLFLFLRLWLSRRSFWWLTRSILTLCCRDQIPVYVHWCRVVDLFGIIVTYYLSGGTLTLTVLASSGRRSCWLFLGFIAFLLGFGIKAGIFPTRLASRCPPSRSFTGKRASLGR